MKPFQKYLFNILANLQLSSHHNPQTLHNAQLNNCGQLQHLKIWATGIQNQHTQCVGVLNYGAGGGAPKNVGQRFCKLMNINIARIANAVQCHN